MQLNKWQKITTIIYAIGILLVLFVLTPWEDAGERYYGTLFLQPSRLVDYKLLYIELIVLTVFYLLALLILKSSKRIS